MSVFLFDLANIVDWYIAQSCELRAVGWMNDLGKDAGEGTAGRERGM